ncbi:5-formyltetrahydrofolate cyclo-ligase [Corynebacterium aquatimens]|uniref:5-formyltetrahydrofolate cyclo-ligase n=1 Tax=Corynebacterium aquatimens TaxID=1190508 RepID=UPI002541DCED|nr:5-formyltetrahydrofolate cyclo-ligase [Corynebacterium aquatimens]QYH20053.1 5-formyltetrahydrofolate cyclo-ligase [Corynebacterium aquatimens]
MQELKSDVAAQKQRLRKTAQEHRAQLRRDPDRKAALDHACVENILAYIEHLGAAGRPITAYAPLPSEPGPADLASRLAAAGHPVWLPISLPDGVLAWARADAGTRPGALGIAEPAGPRFNSNVLRSCALVIAPALAVDASGMRLGKGAGYYDRALAGLHVPVAALIYDGELTAAVPHSPTTCPSTP